MQSSKFKIPVEFRNQLEYGEPLDKRSDDEILASISQHNPVTSEKNIWAYWHAGLDAMPNWCRRNVIAWARICGPSWTVRVLDIVPDSPNYALKFAPVEMLPETFVKGTMKGEYVGPHSADFLRGALLYTHGGAFMDVGNILIRSLDRICWAQLEDPNSPYQVSTAWMYGLLIANHFVASRKGDPFIKRWHDLFIHLWKDQTSAEGIRANPLIAFAANMDYSEVEARNMNWEWVVDPIVVIEYVSQVLAWGRLAMLEDAGDGFNGVEYAHNNVLWFDTVDEDWAAETIVGWRGQALFDALATRLDADPESEEYKIAYKVVWRLLTQSSMQKVAHGKHLLKTPALGLLWDMKENDGKDVEPGTFAELFRYGCTHFKQTRKEIKYVKVDRPKETLKGTLLEAA